MTAPGHMFKPFQKSLRSTGHSQVFQGVPFGANVVITSGIRLEDEPCRAIGPSGNGE